MLKKMEQPPVRRALHQMGLYLASRIQQNIRNGRIGRTRIRANRPATVAKKGSSRPLIDTARMLADIQAWEGPSEHIERVGIPSGLRHSDPRRFVAQVGRYHEAGTVLTESRPFLLPTVLLEFTRLQEILAKTTATHLTLSFSEYIQAVRRF